MLLWTAYRILLNIADHLSQYVVEKYEELHTLEIQR
jgi:hypothetical protein